MADQVLQAIAAARARVREAETDLRVLLAFAREHVRPRPYALRELAAAADMSISGVRTAYSAADVTAAAGLASQLNPMIGRQ